MHKITKCLTPCVIPNNSISAIGLGMHKHEYTNITFKPSIAAGAAKRIKPKAVVESLITVNGNFSTALPLIGKFLSPWNLLGHELQLSSIARHFSDRDREQELLDITIRAAASHFTAVEMNALPCESVLISKEELAERITAAREEIAQLEREKMW